MGNVLQARRIRARALGTSAIASALVFAIPAFAQCAPDPTRANAVTTCTGFDGDGIAITTPGTTVTVESAATVSGLSTPAIAVNIPYDPNVFAPRNASITVAGIVNGGTQSGIDVRSGSLSSGSFDYFGTRVDIAVLAGATVSGVAGITAGSTAGNSYGAALVSLTNAGTISGTGGSALRATEAASGGFDSIVNAATGSIGGISGAVGQLANAGVIDGGIRSAIDQTTTYNSRVATRGWTNDGTIRSTSTAATIANLSQLSSLTNSGTIRNAGTGAAVQGNNLTITNLGGGQIGTAGMTALSATSAINLVNAGTITGGIVADPAQGTGFFSTIDSTAGTINGNVSLGRGNDLVYARYVGTSTLVTGITGNLDGGEGTNAIVLAPTTDLTVNTAVVLPGGFQRLRLDPGTDATVTLGSGFVAPGTIELAGYGSIVNNAAITTNGQAFVQAYYATGRPNFTNNGSIEARVAQGYYAVSLGNSLVTNTGTIVSNGNGVALSGGTLVNSGSIIAANTAVSLFYGALDNRGLIRSTAGIGVDLSGSTNNKPAINSGRIEGATFGAVTGYVLTNSGTIAGLGSGTAVGLSNYGVLNNLAGGTISGGAYAISGRDPYGSTSVYNGAVFNAGTINGDVTFVSSRDAGYNNANRFVALTGGVLNGNLALGTGDTLVVDLINPSQTVYAGINGTVTSNGGLLRYRVNGQQSAVIGAAGPFLTAGYELVDNAQLTLTAAAPQTLPLLLSGDGIVDLTADVAVTNRAALQMISASTVHGTTTDSSGGSPDELKVVSRGTLRGTIDNYFAGALGVVVLGSNGTLQNEGTICAAYTAINGGDAFNAAVAYLSYPSNVSLVNNGRIELNGSYGTYGVTNVTNTGTIIQTGTRASVGIGNASTVTNSGTIQTAGLAISGGYSFGPRVTNSGTIASTGGVAIGNIPDGRIANLAGGTISGVGGTAIRMSGTVDNAGAILGSVDFSSGFSNVGSTYFANGGTVTGNVSFGYGNDTFVALNDVIGVSGTVDGGNGDNVFVHARNASGTVALGSLPAANVINFDLEGIRAIGAGTIVTATSASPFQSDLYVSGDGSIVNTATIEGAVVSGAARGYASAYPADAVVLSGFTNQGTIRDGFYGTARSFINTGTVGSTSLAGGAVTVSGANDISFANSGLISSDDSYPTVYLATYPGSITATNTGRIEGGFAALAGGYSNDPNVAVPPVSISLTNAGVITSAVQAVSLFGADRNGQGGTVSLANTGTIEATGPGGTGAFVSIGSYGGLIGPAAIGVTNSGTIRANGGGVDRVFDDGNGGTYHATQAANALGFSAGSGIASIANTTTGVIEATGDRSVALLGYGAGLDLTNAGTIRGGVGTTVADDDGLIDSIGLTYLAGAIQTVGGADDRIVNTGTIVGSIALAGGNDSIENRGTIRGDVFLGSGDDIFLQQASATLVGTVDGGEGNDGLIVDATGGGAVNGDQFVNFERFTQTGSGNVVYSGSFRFNTIGVSGSSITVAAWQTLSSDGAVTVTGGDGAETVTNNGTIAGSVDLAGGNDRVVNTGAILGSVALGSGDDEYVEGVGSRVAGTVDGGAGNDLYTVVLAGKRSGIGQRTGFERLGVTGSGTLWLALDQDFTTVSLAGTNLNLALAGHRIGSLTGSDAAETVAVDGDIASVSLGGGDDQLSLGATVAMGRYDGGTGNDLLRFTNTGPVTLAGSATGFEQIALAGNALTVAGTLGSTGAPLSFGNGDQQLTLANGGTLAGAIDLGAGNDAFRWMAGGVLNGTVSGGAGNDTATIGLAGDRILTAGVLTGFETLATEGNGTLSLLGAQGYDRIVTNTDLVVLAGASLSAGQVQFGNGNNRLAVVGQFAGSVDGGAGTDTIAVAGGTAAAPVAFGNIASIESFGMASGYATISGTAALGSVDLTGGRLVGLAGSTIGATQITVRQGATFGSAGTVNGNLTVAGTLSPDASPGTMTVNGNVALQGGSVSLFELTPSVSDKLVVNGIVSIASGATLQIVTSGTLRAGVSYDLVVASGGITGAYSTVLKPDSLFGFVVQRADRIQLLGQFLGDAAFSPQVARSIAYANTTLVAQPATSALFAAVPALLTASGASNPTAFAQLTPEAYASATQIGVDNALTLAGAARGTAFAATGDTVHVYTFAQTLGGWHRFGADAGAGTSATQSRNYGFLGGIGIGDASWSIGAFGGYLNTRQQIDRLGARTRADGFVAGVQARFMADTGFGVTGSVLYDGGDASTTRALPGTAAGIGRYDLHSWVGDFSVGYGIALASDWTLRPRAGITYVRTTRDATNETGGSAFALSVARDRHVAGFADAGLFFGRSETSAAPFRPFVSFGGRYQIQGRRVDALAGYAGGGLGLEALGAQRSRLVGTAQAGIGYRLPSGLDLFAAAGSQTGRDDHQETITAGVRLRF